MLELIMKYTNKLLPLSGQPGFNSPSLVWAIVFVLGCSLHAPGVSLAADQETLPTVCFDQCDSPFGDILGQSPSKVVAFSNCRAECVAPGVNTVDGRPTGLKWQCVEYARRWLLINRGAVFGSVDIAADIWTNIDKLTRDKDQTVIPLESHLNGSRQPPQVGDLLIYAKAFYGTGHVAVVIDVNPKQKLIKVGEQNFDNLPWKGTYARQLEYIEKDGRIWILDPYLIGWKQISK